MNSYGFDAGRPYDSANTCWTDESYVSNFWDSASGYSSPPRHGPWTVRSYGSDGGRSFDCSLWNNGWDCWDVSTSTSCDGSWIMRPSGAGPSSYDVTTLDPETSLKNAEKTDLEIKCDSPGNPGMKCNSIERKYTSPSGHSLKKDNCDLRTEKSSENSNDAPIRDWTDTPPDKSCSKNPIYVERNYNSNKTHNLSARKHTASSTSNYNARNEYALSNWNFVYSARANRYNCGANLPTPSVWLRFPSPIQ